MKRATTAAGISAVVLVIATSCGDGEGSFYEFGNLGDLPVPLRMCWLAWGDVDSDGDLDLAFTGDSTGGEVSAVYLNDGRGGLTDSGVSLPGLYFSCAAWGDCDGDGFLDLALGGGGLGGTGSFFDVYVNDAAGGLSAAGTGLPGLPLCRLAWGDADNDGDLDLVATGLDMSGHFGVSAAHLFRNNGGGLFVSVGADITTNTIYNTPVDWGDYDNDGDLDLAVASAWTRLFENQGGTFVERDVGLPHAEWSDLAWGDYDSDGDLDLALAGDSFAGGGPGSPMSKIYRNEGGTFTDIGAGLPSTWKCTLAWGDFDNDGDLDLVLGGAGIYTRVLRNDGEDTFTDLGLDFWPAGDGLVAWGDLDFDGDLDLAIGGESSRGPDGQIYINNSTRANGPPSAPAALSHSVSGSAPTYDVTFSWAPSTDDHTPTPGLTYNLRVWTDDGSTVHEVMPGMSDPVTGRRLIPAMGNVQHAGPVAAPRRSWTLLLPADTYYWTVQAVDNAFAGGPWAPEQQVTVP